MCGLVGAAMVPGSTGLDLEAAVRRLHHRGPDDHGIWRGEVTGPVLALAAVIHLESGAIN